MENQKEKVRLKPILKSIKKLLTIIKEHFRISMFIIVLGVFGGLVGLLMSYLSGQMLDIALSENVIKLIQFGVFMFAVGLTESFIYYFGMLLSGKYRIACGKTLRQKACRKVNSLSINYYEKNHTGSTVSTLISDIDKLESFFVTFVEDICSYFPTRLIGGLALSFIINYKLTLFCLVAAPLIAYLTGKVTMRLKQNTKSIQDETVKYNSLLRDFIGGIHIYKAYNMEQTFDSKLEDACAEVTRQSFIVSKIRNIAYGIGEVAYTLPSLIAYVAGGYLIFRGELTVGGLFVFTNVFFSVIGGFTRLSKSWTTVVESSGISDHFFELMEAEEERISGKDYSHEDFTLEFRNVSFAYYEGCDVLKDVSFTVSQGEKVAIVGASGSGKSTIHKLITGHYDNYTGTILINGQELSAWDLECLRRSFSPVTQEVGLFSGDIRKNIAYGNLDADETAIENAARGAYAYDFIRETENGFDTLIGEGGSKLSGGQRQRIAMARALIKGAPVMLLDEPTSALDTKSEFYIQRSIESLGKDKTVIIIAHRLSTIADADKILVLHDGCIVEQGTHIDLINKKGKYAELYERQIIQDAEDAQ